MVDMAGQRRRASLLKFGETATCVTTPVGTQPFSHVSGRGFRATVTSNGVQPEQITPKSALPLSDIRRRRLGSNNSKIIKSALRLKAFDHLAQFLLYTRCRRLEICIFNCLHGRHGIDRCNFSSSPTNVLEHNIAGKHGPNLVFDF